uniref:Uncharacterized protein LOC101493269 n=1 Tax=Cicer arietinum TaxID=3827 RepID=A0A3Q7YCZ1_CICAR|nr:uncharacterized protein LOC101493269 [Cicer arietinum]
MGKMRSPLSVSNNTYISFYINSYILCIKHFKKETSLPLASDSFSYSWLSNSNNSPVDFLDEEPHRESFSSFYGDTTLEEFNTSNNVQNFNFDTCITQSNFVLVHADEIFSNGILTPVFVDSSKIELLCNTQDPIQTNIGASFSTRRLTSKNMEIHHGFLTRWRKSTWRTLLQFFRYFNPLRQKLGKSTKNNKVDDVDKIDWKASPIGDFHIDHDNSIYDAVLHCKRSIGK